MEIAQNEEKLNVGGILGNYKKNKQKLLELEKKVEMFEKTEKIGVLIYLNNIKKFGRIQMQTDFNDKYYFNQNSCNIDWNDLIEGKFYKFILEKSKDTRFEYQAKLIEKILDTSVLKLPEGKIKVFENKVLENKVVENSNSVQRPKPIPRPRPLSTFKSVLEILNMKEEETKKIKIKQHYQKACPYHCTFNGRPRLWGFLSHLGKLENSANNCLRNPQSNNCCKKYKNDKVLSNYEIAEYIKQIIERD